MGLVRTLHVRVQCVVCALVASERKGWDGFQGCLALAPQPGLACSIFYAECTEAWAHAQHERSDRRLTASAMKGCQLTTALRGKGEGSWELSTANCSELNCGGFISKLAK